ncbi:hypothetical protein [Cylindrospermum sp. FACHB-282]|nr:hypothetical protein [Cylindrospermum sp. FACHB-282]
MPRSTNVNAEPVHCTQRCCVRPWRLPLGEALIAHLYLNKKARRSHQ